MPTCDRALRFESACKARIENRLVRCNFNPVRLLDFEGPAGPTVARHEPQYVALRVAGLIAKLNFVLRQFLPGKYCPTGHQSNAFSLAHYLFACSPRESGRVIPARGLRKMAIIIPVLVM